MADGATRTFRRAGSRTPETVPGRCRALLLLTVPIAALATPGGPAATAAEVAVAVDRAGVRFDAGPGGEPAGTGTVRLRARLEGGAAPGTFDPASGEIAATLGPATLLRVRAGEGADVGVRRDGSWRVDARTPGGSSSRLSFDPSTGILHVRSRRADLSALLAAGPAAVRFEVRIGGDALGADLDFREAGRCRWDYRRTAPGDGGGIAPSGDPVAFETVDSGGRSGVTGFREVVVTERSAWEALWTEHRGGEPLPEVDFGRESVLGVFLGVRPTTGYAVEILSVAAAGDSLDVAWRESAPGEDCVVLQVLTTPFVLVRVPVPGARAAFSGSKVSVPCGP